MGYDRAAHMAAQVERAKKHGVNTKTLGFQPGYSMIKKLKATTKLVYQRSIDDYNFFIKYIKEKSSCRGIDLRALKSDDR